MFFYFIVFVVGVVVGWQFPQPQWTRNLWALAKEKWNASRTTSLK